MTTLLLTLFTTLTHAQAAPLPDGVFKGEGLWKSVTEQAGYMAETRINGNRIEAKYESRKGGYEWNFEMRQTAKGFFDVVTEAHVIGDGYCLDHAKVCHYEIKVGKLSLEETLVYLDGNLYRYGSKQEGSEAKVFWQEALK